MQLQTGVLRTSDRMPQERQMQVVCGCTRWEQVHTHIFSCIACGHLFASERSQSVESFGQLFSGGDLGYLDTSLSCNNKRYHNQL